MGNLIKVNKSVIPFCNVSDLKELGKIIINTSEIDGIGGYIIGFKLAMRYGLENVVDFIKEFTKKPVIYDHQKAGTDIPETGRDFAEFCGDAKVDAIILFPQSGPETEKSWIRHALNNGLEVIVGGRMTHPAYAVSEGGWISDEGALKIYEIAANMSVNNFVVPGNKLELMTQIREVIEAEGIIKPIFYSPGFISQGGNIPNAVKVLNDNFHIIIGRGIYQAADKRAAALKYCSQL